jgi:hypothetical protein
VSGVDQREKLQDQINQGSLNKSIRQEYEVTLTPIQSTL